MKIEFDNHSYIWSHGKAPSGRGSWAFQIVGRENAGIHFSPSMTLTSAKAWMRDQIKAMHIPATVAVVYVEVLP